MFRLDNNVIECDTLRKMEAKSRHNKIKSEDIDGIQQFSNMVEQNYHPEQSIPCVYINIDHNSTTSKGKTTNKVLKLNKHTESEKNIINIDLTKGSNKSSQLTYAVQVQDFRNISREQTHAYYTRPVLTKTEGTISVKNEASQNTELSLTEIKDEDLMEVQDKLEIKKELTKSSDQVSKEYDCNKTITCSPIVSETSDNNVKNDTICSLPCTETSLNIGTESNTEEDGAHGSINNHVIEYINIESQVVKFEVTEDFSGQENSELDAFEENESSDDNVKDTELKRPVGRPRKKLVDVKKEPTVYNFDLDFIIKHGINDHIRKFKGQKPYQCSECNHHDTSKYRLWHHYIQHDGKEPNYRCQVCSKVFNSRNALKLHMRIHTDQKPYNCDICCMSFKLRGSLMRHLEKHEKTKKYTCHICGAILGRTDTLRQHLKIHVKNRPYRCDHCNKCFVRKSALRSHMASHNDLRSYHCSQCSSMFKSMMTLKRHNEAVHIQLKQHKCEICNKAFHRRDMLKEHLRIHTKEKPFKCEHCENSFRHRQTLKRHTYKFHLQHSPFQCNMCGVYLSSYRILKKHVVIYQMKTPTKCKYCEMVFTFHCSFRKHMKTHVEDVKSDLYKCPLCGKVLCSKNSHQRHVKICQRKDQKKKYKYKCRHCDAQFKWLYQYNNHKEKHKGEKRFKCTTCQKAFKYRVLLENHIRSHTGERPFKCKICGSSFTQIGNLARHNKSRHSK